MSDPGSTGPLVEIKHLSVDEELKVSNLMFCVKLQMWDLTAGKLLTDLRLHTAGVNVVEFHPNELLLSSGSSDK